MTGLPRRLATGAPDHAGIVIHGPATVAEVRRWVIRAARATVREAEDLAVVASELVTLVLRYSSGGRVVVELFREEQYSLRATAGGPGFGAATYPHPRGAATGRRRCAPSPKEPGERDTIRVGQR